MKCIKMANGSVRRVADQQAIRLVSQGAQYISKKVWRNNGRPVEAAQQAQAASPVPVEVAEEVLVTRQPLQVRRLGGKGSQIRFWLPLGAGRANLTGTILEFGDPMDIQGVDDAGRPTKIFQVPVANLVKFIGDGTPNA